MPTRKTSTVLFTLILAASFATAQTWKPLKHQPDANLGLGNPLLLTDGTVILHQACGQAWWRLTPDPYGSYLNGTWSKIASLPAGYGPLYFGSAVLADGRVIIEGGEYNSSGNQCQAVWTNQGAIYDPVANTWTSVAPPKGWTTIGDAPSVVLANGVYMQANCCTTEQALLNAKTLTWSITRRGKFDVSDEEGFTLLPDGTVLDVDAYVFKYDAAGLNYEIFNPKNRTWTSGPDSGTVVQLWDSYPNAQKSSQELGPMVLRPDGTVFATGASGAHAAHTSIYDTKTQSWTPGPDFPDNFGVADGPASLLPNGHVLVQASPGVFNLGSRFFEWDGISLADVTAGNTDAPNISSYYGNMLLLPTGEVLFTDFGNVWLYRSKGIGAAWKPQVLSMPTRLTRGHTYTASGIYFNGYSQGAAYGDDVQAATNYPLVRITNRVTGHVFYARTHNHSSMGVANPNRVYTHFDVSPDTEPGISDLQVVCNGIASARITVNVN